MVLQAATFVMGGGLVLLVFLPVSSPVLVRTLKNDDVFSYISQSNLTSWGEGMLQPASPPASRQQSYRNYVPKQTLFSRAVSECFLFVWVSLNVMGRVLSHGWSVLCDMISLDQTDSPLLCTTRVELGRGTRHV